MPAPEGTASSPSAALWRRNDNTPRGGPCCPRGRAVADSAGDGTHARVTPRPRFTLIIPNFVIPTLSAGICISITAGFPQSAARSSQVGSSQLDERDFLFATPLLYFGLPSDGVVYVAEAFVVDEAMDAVAAREVVGLSGFVLGTRATIPRPPLRSASE